MGCLCSCLKQQEDSDGNYNNANEFTPLTTGIIIYHYNNNTYYNHKVDMKVITERVEVTRNDLIMKTDLSEDQAIINQ